MSADPDVLDEILVEIEAQEPQEEPQAEPAEDTPEPQEGAPEAAAEPAAEPVAKKAPEYGEKVQKRIDRLVARQHDALRRAEEAEARAAALEAKLAQMEPVARQAVGESIEAQIAAAEARAEELFNNGDTRGAIKATREAAALELKREWVNRTPQQQEPRPQAQAPQVNEVPDAAHDWVRRNEWFNRDPVLTREAQRIEGSLISQGWDETDQEFYDEIDRQLAERFPGRAQPTRTEPAARPSPATASPVAPAGRSAPSPAAPSRRPGQIRLSREQVDIAQALGITPQTYARQLAAKGA